MSQFWKRQGTGCSQFLRTAIRAMHAQMWTTGKLLNAKDVIPESNNLKKSNFRKFQATRKNERSALRVLLIFNFFKLSCTARFLCFLYLVYRLIIFVLLLLSAPSFPVCGISSILANTCYKDWPVPTTDQITDCGKYLQSREDAKDFCCFTSSSPFLQAC